jgi:2-dehydropantoate 2-reductase
LNEVTRSQELCLRIFFVDVVSAILGVMKEVGPLNILLIGAGSLGLLFAGRLAAVSREIHIVAHASEEAELLQRNGIMVEEGANSLPVFLSSSSNYHPDVPQHGHHASKCLDLDWIFMMVKQKDITGPFIRYVQQKMGEHTKLLCFQNGIGHVERLSREIRLERIYLAITTEAAKKIASGCVQHTGRGMTWIGPAMDEARMKTVWNEGKKARMDEKKLVNLLNDAGFETSLSNQIINIVWNKLLINSVINPLTSILKIPNGHLTSSPFLLQLMSSLHKEGLAAAKASGIQVSEDLWDQLIAVCDKTAANFSSMLQDVLAGRTTEIDWINGSLIQLAAQKGLSLPTHKAVFQMVKAMER